jgi:hypothetical protein
VSGCFRTSRSSVAAASIAAQFNYGDESDALSMEDVPVVNLAVDCPACKWRGLLSETNEADINGEEVPICPECFVKEEISPVAASTVTHE